MSSEQELFHALELAHYANRFRDKIFVVGLPAETPFQDLLLDLKVLTGYRIQVALVLHDPTFSLERLIGVSNKRGTRFHLSLLTELLVGPGGERPKLDFERIRGVLSAGRTPIIAFQGELPAPADIDRTYTLAGEVALLLGAAKLFLVSPMVTPLLETLPRSHVLSGEMEEWSAKLASRGLHDHQPLFAFIRKFLGRGVPDIILIEGKRTNLFREVFTHDGAGILFNQVATAVIRQARTEDITDIALLLEPDIEARRILPVSEDDIEANIAGYWVYEVDGVLVGTAGLKRFGNWAEMAHFSTLPRYRGKGRAKDLALRLVEEARFLKLEKVFALSIDQRMWDFFLDLEFAEVDRNNLPAAWRAGYDLARPSRAFLRKL